MSKVKSQPGSHTDHIIIFLKINSIFIKTRTHKQPVINQKLTSFNILN